MKKILVTGATGLLGKSLVPRLKKIDAKVYTQSLKSPGSDFMLDLSDRDKVHNTLNNIMPNIIINLAALTNVDYCEEHPNDAFLANSCSVVNIVSWILKTKKVCFLIHISTDHLYDGIGPNLENTINIKNVYALSKYSGEIAASLVPSTIIRTNFFWRFDLSKRKNFVDWLYDALKKQEEIKLFSDVFFSPLAISTLIDMLFLIIEYQPVGTFNLGSNEGMSKAQFGFYLANKLSLSSDKIKEIKSETAEFLSASRPKDMRMNSNKFENLMNLKLPTLTEEIDKLVKAYKYE
jgi:dTDP-4-dehydrorhamnose reductase